jgi:F5/8 type C domain
MMNFCTTCGTRLVAGLRFCTSCGAPLSATPVETPPVDPPAETALWTTDDPDPAAAAVSGQRGVPAAAVVAVTAILLAGLAVIAVHTLSGHSTDPAPRAKPAATGKTSGGASTPADEPSQSAAPTTAAAAVVGVAEPGLPDGANDVAAGADITAPPSSRGRVDSNGRPATYPPKAMLDTDPSTAWRMDGDGSGQTITVAFGRRVTVTGLALDPGFDKTGTNEDRWKQNRRISTATFTTDDGSAFTVSFATDLDLPIRDRLQSFVLPAPVETRTLRVHIDATEPKPPRGFDTTAISRLAVLGS